MSTSLPVDRIAGAPISWGLCEVPGWGHQLTPERVLSEMQGLGLAATEFGPPGFLEADANARVAQLAEYGLGAVGGFHVAVLHDPAHDPLPGVDAFIDECLAAKAGMVVVAAGTGRDGYDARPELDETGWRTLLTNLDRAALAAYCGAYALWAEATEAIQKYGAMIKSPQGFPIQSPYLAIANRQAEIMMRIASEFGFTPASRSRIFSYKLKTSLLLNSVGENDDDNGSGW